MAGTSQQKKVRDFHKLSKSQCFDKLNGRDSVCHHLWMYQMYILYLKSPKSIQTQVDRRLSHIDKNSFAKGKCCSQKI